MFFEFYEIYESSFFTEYNRATRSEWTYLLWQK